MPRTTPQAAPAEGDPLSGLMSPQQYQAARQHIFPSINSFQWFMRRNRGELVAAGAIAAPAGSVLVNERAMDDAVLAIGRRRAGA
jgi:hypothetical protein